MMMLVTVVMMVMMVTMPGSDERICDRFPTLQLYRQCGNGFGDANTALRDIQTILASEKLI